MRLLRPSADVATTFLLVLGVLLAGCGTAASPSGSPPASPSPAISQAVPPSPVEGILVSIDSTAITQIRGLTLRTASGQTIDFTIGTLENAVEFPPGHLQEHLAATAPIRVFFRAESDRLVVYRIEDAA